MEHTATAFALLMHQAAFFPHLFFLSVRTSASVDNTLLDLQNSSYRTQPHSLIANYIDILMTAFLMISKDFQPLSEDFRKLFLRPEKRSQTFSETFQRLPKTQRCHFDRTPTNLLV